MLYRCGWTHSRSYQNHRIWKKNKNMKIIYKFLVEMEPAENTYTKLVLDISTLRPRRKLPWWFNGVELNIIGDKLLNDLDLFWYGESSKSILESSNRRSESSDGFEINDDTVGVDVNANDGFGHFKCLNLNIEATDKTILHMQALIHRILSFKYLMHLFCKYCTR